jgi:serine/threonine-protein kinase
LQAAVGVAEAHALGIIHRDLKPANLYLTIGSDRLPLVKVLDFGISKVLDQEDESGARWDSVLGSPQYMSPEQMRAPTRVDARTDIWSLGVILFELLTGRLPFPGRSLLVLFTESLAPPDLVDIRVDVPPKLASVVARCLARQRSERFESVAVLARALLPYGSRRSAAWVERIERISGKPSDRSLPRPMSDGSATIGRALRAGVARSGLLGAALRARVPGLVVLLALVTGLGGVGMRSLMMSSVTPRSQPNIGTSVRVQVLALTPRAVSTQASTADGGTSVRPAPNGSVGTNASSAPQIPSAVSRATRPERSQQIRRPDVAIEPRRLAQPSPVASFGPDDAPPPLPSAPKSTSLESDPLQLDSRH